MDAPKAKRKAALPAEARGESSDVTGPQVQVPDNAPKAKRKAAPGDARDLGPSDATTQAMGGAHALLQFDLTAIVSGADSAQLQLMVNFADELKRQAQAAQLVAEPAVPQDTLEALGMDLLLPAPPPSAPSISHASHVSPLASGALATAPDLPMVSESTTGNVGGESSFEENAAAPAIASVTNAASEWAGGSSQRVTWVSEGTVPKVTIQLVKKHDGTDHTTAVAALTLSGGITNTGVADVTVPSGLTPGEYFVQVRSVSMLAVKTLSDGITIDNARRNRCVAVGIAMLGLPASYKLPYPLIFKITILSVM